MTKPETTNAELIAAVREWDEQLLASVGIRGVHPWMRALADRLEAAEAELTQRAEAREQAWASYQSEHGYTTYPTQPDTGADFAAGFDAGAALAAAPASLEAPTPEQFEQQVFAERERQEAKGYTTEHDREHGIDHLLMWAIEYARRGERVKFAALNAAARELLAAEAMVSLEAVKAETTAEWGVRWTGVEPTVVTDRGAAEADVRRLVEANPEICEAVAREVTEWRPVSTEGDNRG